MKMNKLVLVACLIILINSEPSDNPIDERKNLEETYKKKQEELQQIKKGIEDRKEMIDKLIEKKKLLRMKLTLTLLITTEWQFTQKCQVVNDSGNSIESIFSCIAKFNSDRTVICSDSLSQNAVNDYSGTSEWDVTLDHIKVFNIDFNPSETVGTTYVIKSETPCKSEFVSIAKPAEA
jgi:hypothetical protein